MKQTPSGLDQLQMQLIEVVCDAWAMVRCYSSSYGVLALPAAPRPPSFFETLLPLSD